jgi:hypothetical protein
VHNKRQKGKLELARVGRQREARAKQEIKQQSRSGGERREAYREVGGELGADDAIGSVVAGHLSPHNAELVSLGLVDVGDLLSVVEVASLLVLDTIDLDQVGVVVCVTAASAIKMKGIIKLSFSN